MEMLRTLAGGVAHQFNNIHTALHGNLELLNLAQLDEESRERLNRALFCVGKATQVTRRLMSFVRGQVRGAPTRFALREMLWEVLHLVHAELESEGISVDMRCSANPLVKAERGQIAEVFCELLVNARHALRKSSIKRIRLELSEEESEAIVMVRDTGCGISSDALPRIFQPFFTTKGEHAIGNSPLADVKGMGLGLSIARNIISQSGGSLSATSLAGAGTSLCVRLPVAGPVVEKPPAGREARRGGNVLVVDDEELLRHACQVALRFEGHQASGVGDGAEALEAVRNANFDVVLLDINMPRLNGKEFVRALVNSNLPRKPEVIVMSGALQSHEEAELLRQGVFAVLTKPFRHEVLLGFVAQVVACRRSRRPEAYVTVE